MSTRLLTIAILAVVLVFGSAAVALADDIYVNAFLGDDVLGDGSMVSPYASIDKAMSMAFWGDDIMVAKGIYTENTWLKSGVDVMGAGDDVVFVSSSGDHAFETSGTTDITIDGLNFFGSVGASGPALWAMNTTMTVQFCAFNSNVASEAGGAAYLEESTVTFRGSDFELNEAGQAGGAIDADGCALSFAGCSFTENTSVNGDGGAVHIQDDDGETVTFLDCWFTDNATPDGSGAAVDQDCSDDDAVLSFDTVVFTGGWAESDAGAIDMDDGDLWVMYSTFTDNYCDEDGGAIYSDDASCTVMASTFTRNWADSDGGAISFSDSWGQVTGSTFTSNTADNDGGAIDFYDDDLEWVVEASTFTSNVAGDLGGALAIDFDNEDWLEVLVTGSTFTDNHVTGIDYGDDGLSHEEDGNGSGGAIFCQMEDGSDDCSLTITASTITDNSAIEKGGGIFVRTFNPDEEGEVEDFWSTITTNTISGNVAGDDGGGLMLDLGPDCDDTSVTIAGNTVTWNEAGDDGGGIDIDYDSARDASFTVCWNVVTDNVADNDGGGIEVDVDDSDDTNHYSHDNVFARNMSYDDGGGMSIEFEWAAGADLTFVRDAFEDNWAAQDGGGIDYIPYGWLEACETSFTACEITDNAADGFGGGFSAWDGADDIQSDEVYFTECTISRNAAGESGGGLHVFDTGYVWVTTSTVKANYAGVYGGGLRFDDVDQDVWVNGSTLKSNTASMSAGGMGFRDTSATVEANTVSENTASNRGGGIGVNDSRVMVDRNVISDNVAGQGGGISTRLSSLYVYNNIIEGNMATDEGGGLWSNSRTEVFNNTFVANTADYSQGHAIYRDNRPCLILNNIFWSHDDDLYNANAQYSLTDEGGIGSFNADPMFWDEAGGDYRLLSGSPAIDSGNATHTAGDWAPDWDFRETTRPVDGDGVGGAQWDMGAFEMPGPAAPDTVEDFYTVPEDGSLFPTAPGVLGNDSDINGDSITASLTVGAANGMVFLAPNGSFAYEPNPDWFGTDYFWYVASDTTLTSGPTTVTITVTPVNDPPVGVEDTATCRVDTVAMVNVLTNDSDIDGGALSAWVSTGPSNGTVDLDTNGDAEYTPDAGWFGTDYFWYQAYDGMDYSTPVTVTINVTPADYETVAGPNRYATAVAASKQSYPGTTTVVIVATGENWPDALGGAALAGIKDGPILLTRATALPAEVVAEITRLGATEAYILGGEGAVSAGVKTALEGMGLAVTRLGGANRFATARAIAEEVVDSQGASYDHRAFLCAGANFPDALAASSAAAEMGWPIYLSGPDVLTTDNLVAMLANDALEIVMLGGEGALSAAVEADLDLEFGAANVTRIAGSNRYATGAMVAEWTVDNTALGWDGVAFATGELAPDALAAGPMQAKLGSVLLLTPSKSLNADVRAIITAKRAMINDVRFMGGPAALAPSVKAEIMDIIK